MAKQTSTPADVVRQLTGQVDTLRARIAAAKERREQITAAPRDFAEAVADIDELAAKAVAKAKPNVGHIAARPSGFVDLLVELRGIGEASKDPVQVKPFDLLCAVMPAAVRDWIKAALVEHYDGLDEKPISAKDRAAKLAEVEREIGRLEREEVGLLWQLEDAGLSAPWRGDLDPALVLGLAD